MKHYQSKNFEDVVGLCHLALALKALVLALLICGLTAFAL